MILNSIDSSKTDVNWSSSGHLKVINTGHFWTSILRKTYLRHSILLLDAVDRNLEQLKDRALKDVFQKHVGDQIQAFLKEKDG